MNVSPINSNKNTQNLSFKQIPKKFTSVDNYLIRGPHPNLYELYQLKKEGVTQVYDFRHKSLHGFKFIEKLACKVLGIKYTRKPYSNLYGEYPTIQEFEQMAQSVTQNGERGGKTLFHCNSGRHRTAHMSAFYELTKGKQTLQEVKENLGEDFGEKAKGIIQKQVTDKDYYSRMFKLYDGKNPIKKLAVRINNRYALAIRKGQRMFVDTIWGTKQPPNT